MKKTPKYEMKFLDEGDFVKVMLASDEKLFCDYENKETHPVRVRAPLPNKSDIIKTAIRYVNEDSRYESVEHWINFYNQGRDKEIFEQIQEIRKSVKRIKQYTLTKKIANDALHEYIYDVT